MYSSLVNYVGYYEHATYTEMIYDYVGRNCVEANRSDVEQCSSTAEVGFAQILQFLHGMHIILWKLKKFKSKVKSVDER